jgi:hypothetical protein
MQQKIAANPIADLDMMNAVDRINAQTRMERKSLLSKYLK